MRKSKKSKGGKLKKKLALGSLIQDNPDDHINPSQYGPNNQPDYSIAKPKAPTIGQPKLAGKINPSAAAPNSNVGQGISDAAKSVPIWGAAWGAIDSGTNSALGKGTNKTDVQMSSMFNPATSGLNALKDHDTKGAAASFLLPGLGSKMTLKRNQVKEANKQRQAQSIEDTMLMNNADQPQLMKKGGKLVARRLNVESGGHANPISDDAVEMKANNPNATDSIETEDAFLDNNEIVDRKNRVFSDDLGFAKEAKKLEKQKSEGGRFSKSNERIEGQLDDLFKRQEESKKLSQGGYMSSKAPDFKDKLGFDTIDNPSTHENQISAVIKKHSKARGGLISGVTIDRLNKVLTEPYTVDEYRYPDSILNSAIETAQGRSTRGRLGALAKGGKIDDKSSAWEAIDDKPSTRPGYRTKTFKNKAALPEPDFTGDVTREDYINNAGAFKKKNLDFPLNQARTAFETNPNTRSVTLGRERESVAGVVNPSYPLTSRVEDYRDLDYTVNVGKANPKGVGSPPIQSTPKVKAVDNTIVPRTSFATQGTAQLAKLNSNKLPKKGRSPSNPEGMKLGGKLTARDAIKGEGSSRTPKTEYLSEGGIHIKKSHKGLLHKNLGVKAGHKIPASKLAVHSGDSAALKKRKVFARNSKKWHHDDGGMLAPEGSSLGPEALSANYPQKKTIAHLKARAVSTPKRGFSKGGDGAASWSNRVKYGLAKGGWKDALPEIGNSAATFAPNIASASLQSRLKGPASPQLETATRFQRVDPSSQLAEIDRDASATNALVTRNTAQSSNLTSALGSIAAKKLAAKNQVMGQTQQINAGIQQGEGQIRAGQQARNTARVTDYRNNQVEFGNKKLQLTSENVGNLSAKLQAQSAEKKRMGLDERKFGVIMAAYNNLPAPLKGRYKNVFDYYNQEGDKAAKRLGGWIMKSKRNIKKK